MSRPRRQHEGLRGPHRTRQWGGWGGGSGWSDGWGGGVASWNPLAAACVANCKSSHICASDDRDCRCSASDNQRVIRCLSSSCSDGDASEYQDDINEQFCAAAQPKPTSKAATSAQTATRAPEATVTKQPADPPSPSAVRTTPPTLVTGQTRVPLHESASASLSEESESSSATDAASLSNASSTFPANNLAVTSRNNSRTVENAAMPQEVLQTSFVTPSRNLDITSSSTTASETSSTKASSTRASEPSPMDPFGTGRQRASLPDDGSDFSAGAVAGIVVGVLAFLAVIALLGWCCLRRKREQEKRGSRPISPPTLRGGNAAHATSWIDFDGQRSSFDHSEKEKPVPPIYNMYSSSRSPRMFSAFSGSHTSSDGMPAQPAATLSFSQDSRMSRIWSRMTPKFIDVKRASQISHTNVSSHTPSSFVLPASATPSVYHRSGGTSYFSRLLGHDRMLDRKRPAVSIKRIASSGSLKQQEVDMARTGYDEEELANAGQTSPAQQPSPSTGPDWREERAARPSMSSRKSMPHDVPQDEADLDEVKAASTRAPSVDLAWVTQGMFEATASPHASTYKKVSIRRKPVPSVSSTKSKGRKSMPTISPSFSFIHSFNSSSVPSTPRTPRRNRETLQPPVPTIPGSIGNESPALPSSNNSASGLSRPVSTAATPTTAGKSPKVGRAL